MSTITTTGTSTLPTTTGDCMPVCADYVSCGQTYGGCYTSCPGMPTTEPPVPDYVISACIALGSITGTLTTVTDSSSSTDTASTDSSITTSTETSLNSTSTNVQTAIDTETSMQTDWNAGTTITDTGVYTVMTDTATWTTSTDVGNWTSTTALPVPTGNQSGAGTVRVAAVVGSLVAVALAGVAVL